ncbi:MAG: hypothetical protein JSU96_08575 [Acidobacteriota bacterium]|nr:MAG: hypothetical protein JSU96_08575 [Acidobacteriota bacterium]
MEQGKYTLAGWAAIISALTLLVATAISIYHDVIYTPALSEGSGDFRLILVALAIDVVSTLLGIYAILKFRQLLGERYDFHAVDNLIIILIFAGLVISGIAYAGRLVSQNLPFVFILAFAGIGVGIIGIIFALRLLKVPGSLNGYLKPLAYTQLIGSICFTLVFLAPVGMILMMVFNVLLGAIFLSSDDTLERVDFV